MATRESQETSGWRDTAERIFQNTGFTVIWVIFVGAFVGFVSWPIRYLVLVWWSYGGRAFEEGLHVVKGKPLKFSNGELVPHAHDVVTSFGAFFITVIGLTFLLVVVVRLYERFVGRREERAAQGD
jgi:hypothetical protein